MDDSAELDKPATKRDLTKLQMKVDQDKGVDLFVPLILNVALLSIYFNLTSLYTELSLLKANVTALVPPEDPTPYPLYAIAICILAAIGLLTVVYIVFMWFVACVGSFITYQQEKRLQ